MLVRRNLLGNVFCHKFTTYHCLWLNLYRTSSSDAQIVAARDGPGYSQRLGPSSGGGSRGSFLARYGRDLTREAAQGLLDPVLGREDVIQQCLQILLRRTKNNPVLVGDPGVGKTAVAEGIAQLLAGLGRSAGIDITLPRGLKGRRMVSLDVGSLVAGTQYRGALEERLQGVLREVRAARGGVILFIDELHMLVDAGSVEGGMDAANLLKPALARGELHCMGATTVEEYRRHVESDAAFARRFQAVVVEEPSHEAALGCLLGLRPRYEAHHAVRFTDEALQAAVTAAQRYIPDRRLPDSAIDIMDQAASRTRLQEAAAEAAAAAHRTTPAAPPTTAFPGGAAAGSGAAAAAAGPPAAGSGGGLCSKSPRGPTPAPAPPPRTFPDFHNPASGRSRDEERELLEWFGGDLEQRVLGAGGEPWRGAEEGKGGAQEAGSLQHPAATGGWSRSGEAAAAPGALPPTRQAAGRMPVLDAASLPCPHCGTPTPEVSGALTLVCPKCRACFLNIPPQKLLMGASLFLNKQQSAARVPAAAAIQQASQAVQQLQAVPHTGLGPAPGGATAGTACQMDPSLGRGRGGGGDAGGGEMPVVGASDILAVVAEGAGIPLSHVSRSDWESLLSLETSLRQQVAGQDAAVHAVAAAVRLGRLGLQRGRRPLASFVLKGPRGVGHGTLCKALTTSLFASERALLRFDLSDCTDRTAVSRLVGAPPGYVGYGDGGTLTEAVRRRPHSVVVFDHADRGHPEVLDLLTQIVEQGQLSDSMGRRIDFRNSTVIFSVTTPATHTPGSSSSNNTSSRGTRANEGEGDSATGCHTQPPSPTSVPVVEHELAPAQRLPTSSHPPGGASHAESTASGRASHNAAALSMAAGGQVSRPGTTRGAQRSELPPEMEAAVDAVIQLESLTPEAMQQIVAMQLQECRQMLEEQGLQLKVGDGVGEWLSGRGMSPLDGALPLQLLLRQHVLGPAAHALLEYRIGLAQHSGQSTAGDDTNCRIAVEVAPGGDLLQLRMAP